MDYKELLETAEDLQSKITSAQMKVSGEEDATLEKAYKSMDTVIRELETLQ